MKAELRGQEDMADRWIRAVEKTLDKRNRRTYTPTMKSDIISVRIKQSDMPMVRQAARKAGVSVSSYIRICVMEDFRTLCKPADKAERMSNAMRILSERMYQIEMGAGLQPVPPTPGATSTPLRSHRRAGRDKRERGTS